MPPPLFKDAALDKLAAEANVAQFVSFSPRLEQRHAWLRGLSANASFESVTAAAGALLERSPEQSVNVRSYHPEHPKSREFVYGLRSIGDVSNTVTRLAAAGLFTIINETVDIHDGGVSGVVAGDVIEFAPDATPRCVEEAGTAALPRRLGIELLETVYGFAPDLDHPPHLRIEFSIHPRRRGVRHDHTLVWESEAIDHEPNPPQITWPNRFSQFLGDKVYGLLVADRLGAPVPRSVVVGRKIAPFRFGTGTGTGEVWLRTSPTEQAPGFFTTVQGWRDPFALLAAEDPGGHVASVLAQDAVDATFSGAFAEAPDQLAGVLVEGVQGAGDEFMLGRRAPETLPAEVADAVRNLVCGLRIRLGSVRGEWVFDGQTCWIVQVHRGRSLVSQREIFPGHVGRYRTFLVKDGLEALRALISEVKEGDEGIVLVGGVGITSHFGDVLRQAEVPSYLADADAPSQ